MPADLLTESEATLGLVDTLLEELGATESVPPDSVVVRMRQVLEAVADPDGDEGDDAPVDRFRIYLAVVGALTTLRRTRSAFEPETVRQVHRTRENLLAATSTTELAATDMLDGLDRALRLVDQVEAERADPSRAKDGDACGQLRYELYRLISCLQFQDIAAQQLGHALSVLRDVEMRLESIIAAIDPADGPVRDYVGARYAPTDRAPAVAFDPDASTADVARRQAIADEVFRPRAAGAADESP